MRNTNRIYTMFALLIMVAGSMAVCASTFSPVSGEADCNTGNMTWTVTGCTANSNNTLAIDGTNIAIDSCSVGTDQGDYAQATGAGAMTCVITVPTTQAVGTVNLSVYDINATTAEGVDDDYRMTYCASYGTTDITEATVDWIAGLFAGIAGLSQTLGLAIVAGILVTIIAGFILKVKGLI